MKVWKIKNSHLNFSCSPELVSKILYLETAKKCVVTHNKNGSLNIVSETPFFAAVTGRNSCKYIVLATFPIAIDSLVKNRKISAELLKEIGNIFNGEVEFPFSWMLFECLAKISEKGVSLLDEIQPGLIMLDQRHQMIIFQNNVYRFCFLEDQENSLAIIYKGFLKIPFIFEEFL